MIDTQCRGPIPLCGVQLHDATIGAFQQWIVLQQSLGMLQRAAVVALLFQQINQLLHCAQIALLPRFAQGQDPFLVAAGQQIASVAGDGLCQGALLHRCNLGTAGKLHGLLELDEIHRGWRIRAPLHVLGIDGEVCFHSGQLRTQQVEDIAQVGTGLAVGRIGPKEVGQLLARLG